MRVCNGPCGLQKESEAFYTGRGMCKACYLLSRRSYRLAHREYHRAKGARWYKEHREERLRTSRSYQEQHREAVAAYKVEYRNRHRESISRYSAAWRRENQEWVKRWNATNRHITNALCAKRRGALLRATPPWITETQLNAMKEFYMLAQELAWLNQDGKPLHVDHIVPLQGKDVCGLHVPWNLQLLPRSGNIRKGNRF